jgi:hypothetical protein
MTRGLSLPIPGIVATTDVEEACRDVDVAGAAAETDNTGAVLYALGDPT